MRHSEPFAPFGGVNNVTLNFWSPAPKTEFVSRQMALSSVNGKIQTLIT